MSSQQTNLTISEQRFKTLFHLLDARNEWTTYLPSSHLRYARLAAESPETWLPFLAGLPWKDGAIGKVDDVVKQDSLSAEDVWKIAAIVRKRVTFEAIDHDFFDIRDRESGLMEGDDGGYTDYEQLVREENLSRKERSGTFRLFAYQGTDVDKMPKPLFAGRVRQLLNSVGDVCKGEETTKAIGKLLEIERNDGYDTVEKCLTAVDAFVEERKEALGESCTDVETMVGHLRTDYAEFKEWHEATVKSSKKTEGVLGATLTVIEGCEKQRSEFVYDEETVAYRSKNDGVAGTVAKRPRVPKFGAEIRQKSDDRSLWDILGPRNAIVKNLSLYERMNKLKKEMYRLRAIKNGETVKQEDEEVVLKPEADVIEIGEEVLESGRSRSRAMGEACVSLLVNHTGFTHIDEPALRCLTDVLEDFLGDLGKELTMCRENIDNNEATVAAMSGRMRTKTKGELMVEMELIMSCVKGGFAELQNYVKVDMMRTEQALREVGIRLSDRVKLLGGSVQDVVDETIDGNDLVVEGDIAVGEGLAFGYLGKRVWIDVLDGIRVPKEMVFGKVKDELQLMAVDT